MSSISSKAISPQYCASHTDCTNDRRASRRQHRTYLTAMVEHAGLPYFGVIRNESAGGFMIECDCPVAAGDEVVIVKNDGIRRVVEVVWADGLRFGTSCRYALKSGSARMRPRPVRIPTSFEAKVWRDGAWVEVGVANVSQKGILAFGLASLEKGLGLTLQIGSKVYTNVVVRWWADGASGLQFGSPLSVAEISNLIISQREKPIRADLEAKLLEVVPANDKGSPRLC